MLNSRYKTQIAAALLGACGLFTYLCVFLREQFLNGLPLLNYLDSGPIESAVHEINTQLTNYYTPDFMMTARIYAFLGITSPELAGFVSVTLVIATMIIYYFVALKNNSRISLLILSCATILLAGLYYGVFTKDIISFVLVTIPFLVFSKLKNPLADLPFLAGLAIIGLNIRQYFLITLGFYAILRVLTLVVPPVWASARRYQYTFDVRIRPWVVPLIMIVLTVLGCIALTFQQEASSPGTATVMYSRIHGYGIPNGAGSITPYLFEEPGLLPDIINSVILVPALMFPVTLLLTLNPYYIAIFIVFAAFFGFIFYKIRYGVSVNSRAIRPLLFLISYISVAALFEPDYGAVLRHFVFVLPICLVLIKDSDSQ